MLDQSSYFLNRLSKSGLRECQSLNLAVKGQETGHKLHTVRSGVGVGVPLSANTLHSSLKMHYCEILSISNVSNKEKNNNNTIF